MKLTEEKLKQMILEAIKNKSFQDFEIQTPDEKLRAELGDEMFDKIQSLGPEQGGAMKQTFDPNYPESIKQESLDAMLVRNGFEPYNNKWIKGSTKHTNFSHRSWFKGEVGVRGTVKLDLTYNIHDSILHYKIEARSKRKIRAGKTFKIASGKIEIPPMFELSLETEQGIKQADALMLSKEAPTVERALGMYK